MAEPHKDRNSMKIYCPKCGKWLMSIDIDTKGTLYPFCKRCHAEVEINVPITSDKTKDTKQHNDSPL